MSIKKDWNNEPAIQQKLYSQEEYIKKKNGLTPLFWTKSIKYFVFLSISY
jgi:hypothetical protein